MREIYIVTILLLMITIVSSFIIKNSVYNRNRILLADNKEIKPFSEEWAKLRGMEPGYGGNIRLIIIINTI